MRLWVFLSTYPYFLWSMVSVMLFILGFLVSPVRIQRYLVFSSVLALPFAFSGALAVPLGYWDPNRLWPFWFSLEDFLCSFGYTGLSTGIALWTVRRRLVLGDWSYKRVLFRYAVFNLLITPVALATLLIDLKPMSVTLLPMGIGFLTLLWISPSFGRAAACAAAGLAAIHLAILEASFACMPHFAASWNTANLWGPALWGIPVDEIAWAALLGASWPLFTCYLFGAKLAPLGRLEGALAKGYESRGMPAMDYSSDAEET